MDLDNIIGGDLAITSPVSATADLSVAVNPVEGQQRVLRRLLTNPKNYVWQPIYGAGLAKYIGQPMISGQISGNIRQQMRLEQAVVQSPPPAIALQFSKVGEVLAQINYIDAESNLTSSLSVPISQILLGD